MPGQWMIYGANGYTGELCARVAVGRGLRPVLAGRRAEAVAPLAAELGCESRAFALDGAAEHMKDIDVVLHCAGPFSATARPMAEACAAARTHYCDVTGEIDVFEYVHGRSAHWRDAGIVALPGAGFDVVPSDCLAAMLKAALPDADTLTLAFRSSEGRLSPGTTKTMIEGMGEGLKVRRDGRIVSEPAGRTVRTIPFASGAAQALAIPWGDVSTAYYTTGIPNIAVFMGAPPHRLAQMRTIGHFAPLLRTGVAQWILKSHAGRTVKGPTEAQRAADGMELWGEARNAAGGSVAMTMTTPNGYSLTADAAVRIAQRLLEAPPSPGAHTPATAFGADFVRELDGVTVREA